MGAMPDNTSLSKTELDAATDSPVNARAQIETMYDKLLAVINAYADANGLCDLDASSLVPAARLNLGTQNIKLNTKVIDIGDWNMDANTTATVSHGLTLTKIRAVSALIRNDADTTYHVFEATHPTASASGFNRSGIALSTTDVNLTRVQSGYFDGVDYNATSYNRGWITIQYVD